MHEHDNTLTPHLVVHNAAAAIEFYKKALDFVEEMRMPTPDGKILHCKMTRGRAVILLCDEFSTSNASCRSPQALNGSTVTLHLAVPDIDATFARAVAAGAKAAMPPADMFWGDRYGKLTDPFGHHWSLSTHKREVSPEEMKKAAAAMFSKSDKNK
jgi:uncharacterized glyoxalase superfamily protein PhnB